MSKLTLKLLEDRLASAAAVTVFVADRVQGLNSSLPEKPGACWSGSNREDLSQRRGWIGNLRNQVGNYPQSQPFSVIGVDDLQGVALSHIHRNLVVLRALDADFREDLEQGAARFVASRRPTGEHEPVVDPALRLEISESYLFEETAINIYLRCVLDHEDEYYFGAMPEVIKRVHQGRYRRTAWELAERPPGRTRIFHEWLDGGWVRSPD